MSAGLCTRLWLTLLLLGGLPAIAQDVPGAEPVPLQTAPTEDEAAGAQAIAPLEVTSELSRSEVTLGTPFTLTLSIRHAPGQRWELSATEDLGAFTLLTQQRSRTDSAEEARTTFTLELSLFELGEQELQGLPFEVTTAQGTQTWTSEPVVVTGLSSLPDQVMEEGEELRGFKPAEDVPVFTLRLLWYALAGLALLVLLWFLYRWWRARPPKAAPAPVLAPLDVRTRKALLDLRAEKLHETGAQKAFYSRLSEILRAYVGERYGVEAMESTTYELSQALSKTSAPKRVVGSTRTMLEEADLVKFAKLEVDPTACNAAIDAALRLVDEAEADAATSHPATPPGAPDAA